MMQATAGERLEFLLYRKYYSAVLVVFCLLFFLSYYRIRECPFDRCFYLNCLILCSMLEQLDEARRYLESVHKGTVQKLKIMVIRD